MPLPPPAKAALNKLIASGRPPLVAVLALCDAITSQPERYPELVPLAHAVLQALLPQPKATGRKEAA